MNDYTVNSKSLQHPLGELYAQETKEGSFTLKSNYFKELFHDSEGALKEASSKYLEPADLDRFKQGTTIRVLDVCVGLGYNTACVLEALREKSLGLNWWGLEIDQRPIKIALDSPKFRQIWSRQVLQILEELRDNYNWKKKDNKGQLLWGDARQSLKRIPQEISFDLIMLDPFSPKNCPELWTEEFLQGISRRLTPGGRLLTYCSAAAVRSTLRRSGLLLRSLTSPSFDSKKWSAGTMAILLKKNQKPIQEDFKGQKLSQMEEEHLLTRAAIPYRDPNGCDKACEIRHRRTQEQLLCQLESTSSWQRRWFKT